MVQKRVVLVGDGAAISTMGVTPAEIHERMLQGKTGLVEVPPEYRMMGMHCRAYGPLPANYLDVAGVQLPPTTSEQVKLAVAASVMALKSAGIMDNSGTVREECTGPRIAISIGAGGSPISTIERYLGLAEELRAAVDATDARTEKRTKVKMVGAVRESMTSAPSAGVGVRLPFYGERVSVGSACATGLHNIIALARQILLDEVDAGIAGGVEDTCARTIQFFDVLGALSTSDERVAAEASAVFAAERDGFVPASGAGMVVLASEEFALRHQLPIAAYLESYASNSNTGKSMSDPTVEGEVRLLKLLLERARVSTQAIDLVSAHGTATPTGDLVEGQAIKAVFGEARPIVLSLKRWLGHLLGASGALAAAVTLQQMKTGLVPGMQLVPDAVFAGLNLAETIKAAVIRRAIVASYGFGGTNAALLLRAL